MPDPMPHILLCPGQGAQHVGMGQAWFEASKTAREVFVMADDALGFELSRLCFEGPENQLNRTDMAQVAIYTASVACYQGLMEAGQIQSVAAAAGLSLGEFTALHLAGVYDFVTGLRLVELRGKAMQDAAEASPTGSGMVALIGAQPPQAQQLCENVCHAIPGSVLVPANYNCPGQIVISGSQQACDRAVAIAGQMGLRATPLQVAGAFHSPLMAPAADRLRVALDQDAWQAPTIPVVSNVTAQPHNADRVDAIKDRLVQQLTSPVKWTQSMAWLIQNVSGQYVEVAPGKVLAGLMKKIDRSVKVLNVATPTTTQPTAMGGQPRSAATR